MSGQVGRLLSTVETASHATLINIELSRKIAKIVKSKHIFVKFRPVYVRKDKRMKVAETSNKFVGYSN